MKPVTITTKKWRSEDGLLFSSKQACADHEQAKGLIASSEAIHRRIQRMKACHGPYLAKSFREYNQARERAEAYLKGYVLNKKSMRTPGGTEKLGRVLIEYANAWQDYNNKLWALRTLQSQFATARANEKAERDKETDNG